jgi:hypothetical protein
MPQHFNWIFLYEKHIEMRLMYLKYIDLNLNAKTTKTNKSRCTQCDCNTDNHQMETSRLVCSRKMCKKACHVKFKVCHCFKTDNYYFFKLNQHVFENYSSLPLEVKTPPTTSVMVPKIERRCITPKVKKLIKRLILDFDDELPRSIEKKILAKYKHKIESSSNESMPSLIQIQNFVRNFRKQNTKEIKSIDKTDSSKQHVCEKVRKYSSKEQNDTRSEEKITEPTQTEIMHQNSNSPDIIFLDEKTGEYSEDNVEKLTPLSQSMTVTPNCVNNEAYVSQYNLLAMQFYRNFLSTSSY